jgi:hypothetical protein
MPFPPSNENIPYAMKYGARRFLTAINSFYTGPKLVLIG